ncbi:hypothetical protein C8R47DRAFT_1225514 [Mycena vitilis]|nr:hypothetical protein C8R47DRAFT_1225514 [Mycena vitilis]
MVLCNHLALLNTRQRCTTKSFVAFWTAPYRLQRNPDAHIAMAMFAGVSGAERTNVCKPRVLDVGRPGIREVKVVLRQWHLPCYATAQVVDFSQAASGSGGWMRTTMGFLVTPVEILVAGLDPFPPRACFFNNGGLGTQPDGEFGMFCLRRDGSRRQKRAIAGDLLAHGQMRHHARISPLLAHTVAQSVDYTRPGYIFGAGRRER